MKKLFNDSNFKGNSSQMYESNYNNLSNHQGTFKETLLIFLGLLTLTIIIKLPSFFRQLDLADEATFILMAQSILDGHLPYTELWDIKPPLSFFLFTIPIILFGKSLAAVRLYASIYIALSGLAVYMFAKREWNHRTGIIGSVLLIVIVGLGTNVGKVSEMTTLQQIAIAPLMASLAMIGTAKITLKKCFFTGILMGFAISFRPNLIYVGLIVGFAILLTVLSQLSRSVSDSIKKTLAYGFGIGLILFLNYLPYLISGYHQLWWNSLVLASLSYSDTDLSMLGAGAAQARYLLRILLSWSHAVPNFLVWLGGLGGLVTLVLRWPNLTKSQRIAAQFLFIFLIATELSILRGGRSFSSYHIQLYPMLSVAAAILIDFLSSRANRSVFIGTIAVCLFSIVPLLISEYKILQSRLFSGQSLNSGVCYEIAEYLKQENYSDEPIFMLNCHIVYWFLDTKPLSKSTTQPYNITNGNLLPFMAEPGATTESELVKIFAQNPKYIIAKGGFKKEPGRIFRETLRVDYELVRKIENIKIYRIRQESSKT